jgi:hypothetical protein
VDYDNCIDNPLKVWDGPGGRKFTEKIGPDSVKYFSPLGYPSPLNVCITLNSNTTKLITARNLITMVMWEEYDPQYPPLSYVVTSSPLPNGFQLPRIQPYDGSTDPDDHLKAFYVHMILYGASDPIFCKAFPCTLTGPALRWFFTLPAFSISYFSQLTKEFLKRFKSSSPNLPTELTSLKQGDDESLKDYVNRFDKVAEKEVELSSRVYVRLMVAGLKPGSRFKESLVKEPVLHLEDLWRRASRFVDEDHNTQP